VASDDTNLLRRLPKVDRLLDAAELEPLLAAHPRPVVLSELRALLDALRDEIRQGQADPGDVDPRSVAARLAVRLVRRARPFYRRVINGTGVVLHTGLGRAVLAPEVADAVGAVSRHPQRLEIELDTGERGGRDRGCAELVCRLTGAEAATVVNNNAAATLLILAAFARGRRAVVSRGELVEIGGSYRIPDVMEESGALLAEVGTTNRTHLRDYRRAIERFGVAGAENGLAGEPGVGLLLKVHTSNYRVVGFTSAVGVSELVALGREHSIPVVHDLGSGCMVDLVIEVGSAEEGGDGEGPSRRPLTSWGETLVRDSLAAGVDLVCFSGDKLLGGPQAGIIVGRKEAVDRCRRHPLFRAIRPGRMVYTALEATLRIYEAGEDQARLRIPALARMARTPAELGERAAAWAERWQGLAGYAVEAVAVGSQAGSGSVPGRELPSWGLRVVSEGLSAEELARELRTGAPAILPRVMDDAVVFDLRTLEDGELEEVAERLGEIGG